MAKYIARQLPTNLEELITFLHVELQEISNATGPTHVLELEKSHKPPLKLREGMIVLADGTNWNPGSGAGFYGYRNGAWRLLG